MSIGEHGTLRLTPDGEDTWQVQQLQCGAPPEKVAEHLALSYAQGWAEDAARHLGVERLVATEAPWRAHPASEKQVALLKKFDIAVKAGLTKPSPGCPQTMSLLAKDNMSIIPPG